MEGSIVLVLVLGLIVGGMTLMLAVGYVSTEKDRAARREHQAEAPKAEPVVSVPSFFAPSRAATPIAFVFDDGLVHRLEDHVRIEQAVVAQFVHQPSIDNLYRKAGTEPRAH